MIDGTDTGDRWEWLTGAAPLVTVVGIAVAGTVLVSAISYQHEYELARHNEQAPWVSSLIPGSIDGVLFVAGVALLWAALNGVRGWRRLWQPAAVLAAGVLVTIAANGFSDLRFWWLGPVVSGWSGVSLVLMSVVAFWLPAERRKMASGDTGRRTVTCSCPPSPVSLAEALPLARARLRDEGQPAGEDALAERFATTRHQVRLALAAAVKAPYQIPVREVAPVLDVPAGVPPGSPAPAPAGALNGGRAHG